MNATPAGSEPHRPTVDGPLAPTAPGTTPTNKLAPLTHTQKILTGIVVGAVLIIATLGFIGSYSAVTDLATAKGFGKFAQAFPIAVDAGIIAFLALDLLLTWRRIAFPLLRYTAWALTGATIAFNAATAWPDWLGVSMHGTIPVLFVIAVEAARHAIGRIADITADKHLEGPNASRWLLNPAGTFILWRRQRLWGIRLWDTVLELERERRIYVAQLRRQYGRWGWRRKASADQLLVLSLAKDGMSVSEAIELPAREEAKRRQEQDRIALEQQRAADERRREAEAYRLEQQRLEDERARKVEADRLERERQELELEQQRQEAARQQQIADAQARAQLADIARREQESDAQAEHHRRQQQIEDARRLADEEQRAAEAAKVRKDAEEAARLEAERKLDASRRAAEMLRAASASPTSASRSASASGSAANGAANASANGQTGSASPASRAGANDTANTTASANASASQSAATTASAVDIAQVVDVYQLLEQRDGKAPSDQKLGDALGVSRSRAQQLRTLAIQAGHTELAKPVRLAS